MNFQLWSGRLSRRRKRTRCCSLDYSFEDPSIQDLGKFGTCVSEASYLADRVMALVPTDIEH